MSRCDGHPASADFKHVADLSLTARGRPTAGLCTFDLPRETLAYLDEIKERQGLRNRGQVLEQLIELRRSIAQQ